MLDFLIEDICTKGNPVFFAFQIARWVIRIIQIAVPFALIIFGSLDFFKALIANDEKEMRTQRKPFVKRIIVSIIIIMLPTLVNMLLKSLAKNTNNKFAECWNLAGQTGDLAVNDDSEIWDEPTVDPDVQPLTTDEITVGMQVRIVSGQGAGHVATVKEIIKESKSARVVLNDTQQEIVVSTYYLRKESDSTDSTDTDEIKTTISAGDKVKILKGDFAGQTGVVKQVHYFDSVEKYKVQIDGTSDFKDYSKDEIEYYK